MHLALGALVNALWDLWAKTLGKPVWKVIADMTPEEVVRCIDFRYITDALTPEEAVALLKEVEGGKAERIKEAGKVGLCLHTRLARGGWGTGRRR